VRIEVTQDDIDNGTVASCLSCPVAIAIKRVAPTPRIVSVARLGILYGSKYIPAPIEVCNFIDRYDHRLPTYPFTFELEIPEAVQ
jgi:hypothetical protein